MQPRADRLRGVEPFEIARGQRHDPGAQRSRRGAFVLPGLRIDPVRERDEGDTLAQPRTQCLLVGSIGIGVHQRYRDRRGAALVDAPNRLVDRPRIHRFENPTFVIEPLAHLEAKLGRHLRGQLGRKIEAVEMSPVLAPDGEGVGKPAGGDQGDLGQVVLDDGVGHEGRSVDEIIHVRPCETDRPERVQQSGHAVVGPRTNLRDPRVGAVSIDCDDVGERAADVDSDLPSARHGGDSEIKPRRYR